jgi:hypothetical protein
MPKPSQAKPSQAKTKRKKDPPSHLTHSPTSIHTYLNKQTKEKKKEERGGHSSFCSSRRYLVGTYIIGTPNSFEAF